MTTQALKLPAGTYATIKRFAELTKAGDDQGAVARVVQDALRTYEWVLAQQARNRVIAALEPGELDALAESKEVEGEREYLARIIDPAKAQEARTFLWEP